MKKWYILMLLMSLWFIGAQAQETVRGVVTDAAGEPLIGANVVEKGQPSNGTITNLDGKFTLKVTSNKAIIAISMIGNENCGSYRSQRWKDTYRKTP
ncbi:carboxypeptidase-like regulatory domain-containing protein [Bacteroides caccae]|nr:carboxypeptidase-like regulatory domain-containing protein [Bacteroides caccae]UVQ08107.1 carboxypeptidase-like regulatory domain-containing protein [Bacteroides caccae]